MPSADTFSIAPIRELLRWRLKDCAVIVDPFARNSRFGTLTNDLNPETAAGITEGVVRRWRMEVMWWRQNLM